MAIETKKDELKIEVLKDNEKCIIQRNSLFEYDFANIVNMYQSQLKILEDANNFLDKIKDITENELKNIRENSQNKWEELQELKKSTENFFKIFEGVFVEIIENPEKPKEKTLKIDRDVLNKKGEEITGYLVEMYNEYLERKKTADGLTYEEFNKQLEYISENSLKKLKTFMEDSKIKKEQATKTIEIYEKYIKEIADIWGITLEDIKMRKDLGGNQ